MGQTTFSGPVKSDNGFIENSFTTAERDAIANPVAGLLIYNTTDNVYQVYNGTTWVEAFAPPAPPGVTYTQGVDYGTNGVRFSSMTNTSGTLVLSDGAWSNQTALAQTGTQPNGTQYTVIIEGNPYVITITANWSHMVGMSYYTSGTIDPPMMPTPGIEATSISFVPA